jgi:D-aspartate ligase
MEFKRDTRTGRFFMVEPTVGRTDYQEEVATLNGANISYAAYCGELGRSASPARSSRRAAA